MRSLLLLCLAATSGFAAAPPAVSRDRDGDPLPPGAKARLGTARFRAASSHVLASPDGERLALCCPSGAVRLVSSRDGKDSLRIALAGRALRPAAFSPDGRSFATTDEHDGRVHVWDAHDGRPLAALPPAESKEPCLVALPDGKSVATWDGKTLVVRDLVTGMVRRERELAKDAPAPAAFSPDGLRLAAVGDQDRATLSFHRTTEAKEAASFRLGYWGGYARIEWSRDGRRVALFGLRHDYAQVRDVATGKEVCRVSVGAGVRERAMAFSPDGKALAVATNLDVLVCDAATGRQSRKIEAVGRVARLLFVAERRLLVVLRDGAILAFDPRDGDPLPQPSGPSSAVVGLAFSGDGSSVLRLGGDGEFSAYDARTAAPVRRVRARAEVSPPATLSASRDGLVALGKGENHGRILTADLKAGKAAVFVRPPREGTPPTLTPTLSPSGRLFAQGGGSGQGATLRDARTGEVLATYGRGAVVSSAFSPDERQLALASCDGEQATVRLYDVKTASLLATLPAAMPACQGLHFSPDGRLVALTGPASFVVWEAITGEVAGGGRCPEGYDWRASSFDAGRLRRAGTRVALVADERADDRVVVWDARSGETVWSRPCLGAPPALALSPDGLCLAVGRPDTSSLLYDLPGHGRAAEPTPAEARRLSADLGSPDAARAWAAVRSLADHPAVAVPLLGRTLKPAVAAAPGSVLARLASEEQIEREGATARLAEALADGDEAVEWALRGLTASTTAEVRRRAERLLLPSRTKRWLATSETAREVRAVAVLERIANADAVEVLSDLAEGWPSRTSAEAKAALARLKARERGRQ